MTMNVNVNVQCKFLFFVHANSAKLSAMLGG